jgi:hypothetical protein
MTHAMAAAVDHRHAQARAHLAQYVCDAELTLTSYDGHRDTVISSIAVALLEDYGSDLHGLAYVAAEAIAQLVPPITEETTAEPEPPALDGIRLASDYPGFGG